MKVKEFLSLCLFDGEYKSLVKRYNFENLLNRWIGNLSAGEKKKLALISLFENDPNVIFIDEITTGLDVTSRRNLLDFIKNENKKGEKTIIMVTHYLEEADEISDKLIFLKKGEIIEMGMKNDLLVKHDLQRKMVIETKEKIKDINNVFLNAEIFDNNIMQIPMTDRQPTRSIKFYQSEHGKNQKLQDY